MRIAICIITYRRPASLMRLLGSLQDLVLPATLEEVSVVVVDDMKLFHVVDDPDHVVEIIKCHFERIGHTLQDGRDTP